MKRRKFISGSITAAAGAMLLPVIAVGKSFQFRQSSLPHFRVAEKYIRNGSIGKLESIKIGLQLQSIERVNERYSEIVTNVTNFEGPVKIEGTNFHYDFIARADFENGITLLAGSNYPDGIRFEGTDGWIFIAENISKTEASNRKLLDAITDDFKGTLPVAISLEKDPDLVGEAGLMPCNFGILIDIAMKTGRLLVWDPVNGRFKDDFEANMLL